MKLSTNSRYGLRAMVDLTANYSGVPLSLGGIAERQRLSLSYLEQAFSMLRKAGFVRGVRGAQGGYAPCLSAESVRVGDILRTLEGDLSIIEDGPTFAGTDAVKRCIKESIWDAIEKRIAQTVDSITLADLVEKYRRMRGNALEYQI